MLPRRLAGCALVLALVVWANGVWGQGRTLRKGALDDDSKFTNVGNIGLTVTNYGTFGNGFSIPGQPSCEYPLGSGIEHVFDGGLWVGAKRADGKILVTTGAVDIASLRDVAAGFEFTAPDSVEVLPDGSRKIIKFNVTRERSSLFGSRFYHPQAISHQDFIADFTDTNRYVPVVETIGEDKYLVDGPLIPQHTPMGLVVHLETYAWNFPFADAFVILNYRIKNVSGGPLRDVYVGLWADLVVRNTNITPPRVGAPFYQHVANGYIDSLHLAYAFDYNGDPGFTDDGLYVALKFLGSRPAQSRTTYNAWLFRNTAEPVLFSPSDDLERYQKMAESLPRSVIETLNDGPGNYMTLIATGPFAEIPPDSSINVVFAVVCAPKYGSDPNSADTPRNKRYLVTNAEWADRAYRGEDRNNNGVLDPGEDINANGKLDRFMLPTPPTPPHVKLVPGDHQIEVYWDDISEHSVDLVTGKPDFEGYRVYRSKVGEDLPGHDLLSSLELIAEFDSVDGIGYDTGFELVRLKEPVSFGEIEQNPLTGREEPVVYRYRLVNRNLLNGWQYAYAVTAFDRGNPEENLPSLESSPLVTAKRAIPGSPPNVGNTFTVGVYPNPYRVHAAWDGHLERDRKLYFYNLPPHCEVRIFTLAGNEVDRFVHNAATYTGEDIQWFLKFGGKERTFPGGLHAWDLVTANDQAIASGLYLYTVEDLDTGQIQRGKFLVIK